MNVKKRIKSFWIDECNQVSLEISIEDVYYVYFNNEMITNSKKREDAEQTYESLKRH
jgi:hypothetical protein